MPPQTPKDIGRTLRRVAAIGLDWGDMLSQAERTAHLAYSEAAEVRRLMATGTCVECGASFTFRLRGRAERTCSDDCRGRRKRSLARERFARWLARRTATTGAVTMAA